METKARIIDSAFVLFAKKGIRFSLAEVAKEVGIKKASIYAHFDSKEMLMKEIIDKEMKAYFFEINKENDDLEKIFYGVLDYYNNSQIKLQFWKRLLLLPPEAIEASLIEKVHKLSDDRFMIVQKLISEKMKKGLIKENSEEAICLMFFSLIHGLLSSQLIYQPINIRQHYDIVWKQFLKGIST